MGARAEVLEWTADSPVPDGVAAIACALPAGVEQPIASRRGGGRGAVRARRVTTSTTSWGCAASPSRLGAPGSQSWPAAGWHRGSPTCSRATPRTRSTRSTRSGSPRSGTAGDACVATAGRSLRGGCAELRDGVYDESRRRGGHELVWFPEPIGPRECERVATGVQLLSAAVPDADRITVRLRPRRAPARGSAGWVVVTRKGPGARSGSRCGAGGARRREPIVYGAIERTAIAAGTVLGSDDRRPRGRAAGAARAERRRLRAGRCRPPASVPRGAVASGREGRDLRGCAGRLTDPVRRATSDRTRWRVLAHGAIVREVGEGVVDRGAYGGHRSPAAEHLRVERRRDLPRCAAAFGSSAASAAAYSGCGLARARGRSPRRAEPLERGESLSRPSSARPDPGAVRRRTTTSRPSPAAMPSAASTPSALGAQDGTSIRALRYERAPVPAASMAESPASGTCAVGSKACQPTPGKYTSAHACASSARTSYSPVNGLRSPVA